MLEAVSTTLAEIIPEGVQFAITDPSLPADDLLPEELKYVSQAVEKRKREFAAGRRAARLALGRADINLPVGANRAPVWPRGWVGSISHCEGCCVAVACRDTEFSALGVDVEIAAPLGENLISMVLGLSEFEKIGQSQLAAMHTFSCKEASYKALCGKSAEIIEFKDICVLDYVNNSMKLRLTESACSWPVGTEIDVHSVIAGKFILSFTRLK